MGAQLIRIISLASFLTMYLNANTQELKQSAFTFHYNYQIPIGKLSMSFGNSSSVGTSYFFEKNNNIIFGVEANYIFGVNIKDSTIFENISTSNGYIIGSNGEYANVSIMQRGFDSHILVGYGFHFRENSLNGIYITQGFGYLQHQIFIDTRQQNIPQLNENMKKGYDRFSNGLSTKFSLDYKYYHPKGRFLISSGVNYTAAYTKNNRAYNYANNEYYSNNREWDNLLGIKVEIIIPIRRKNKEKFHYY